MGPGLTGRIVFILSGLGLFLFPAATQTSVRQVRALPPGAVVTTTGTVTTGEEWGFQRYIQDQTAGIAAYGSSLAELMPGDSIRIRGVVSVYRGEYQLSPVFSIERIDANRPIPVRSAPDMASAIDSGWQAMVVRCSCVAFESCYDEIREGPMRLYDRTGQYTRVVVPEGFSGLGAPIGPDMFAEGILAALEDQPFLRLKDAGFNESGDCRHIAPALFSHANERLRVTWSVAGTLPGYVEWRRQDTLLRLEPERNGNLASLEVIAPEPGALYGFSLTGFRAAGDSIRSPVAWIAIPGNSGQDPLFFFNRSVDNSYSDGSMPDGVGTSEIETDIVRRIDAAVATLDVAMYNTSRDAIVQALRRAVTRGVRVRYVADATTSNNALEGVLPFPVLFRQGDGIMHHKFVIGDAEDPAGAWVWAGSTNFSQNQLTQDPNHAIVIFEQAIARTYQAEFDEMWGSIPKGISGRTGDLKLDDTPHDFIVGGNPVELYFSPSDETGCQILRTIESADERIMVALLILTRDELIDALVRRHQDGLEVRVIVDDEESSAGALARLRAAGVPVRVHRFSPIFHHKYVIVDEGTTSDPVVATGSHNWTFSADRINDENLLLFHDQRAANIFRQEFEARWAELSLTDLGEPARARGGVAFPNPAYSILILQNHAGEACRVRISDLMGRELSTANIGPGAAWQFQVESLPPQLLAVQWQWPDARQAGWIRVGR